MRENYLELIHRAPPDVKWQVVEANNRANLLTQRQMLMSIGSFGAGETTETFGNGLNLSGKWVERGSNNLAGNVLSMDYAPATGALYLVSAGGTLWKGVTTGSTWKVLNQDIQFNNNLVKILPNASSVGGNRLFTSFNYLLQYSDDEGKTFTPSAGLAFPVAWGGNMVTKAIIVNGVIYCLAVAWDPTPWAPRYWLFRSTDKGLNFTKIKTWDFGDNETVSITKAEGSNDIYAFDTKETTGSVSTYSISGATVKLLNSAATSQAGATCELQAYAAGGKTVLYTMLNNSFIFLSKDLGKTWIQRSTLPEDSWDRFNISNSSPGTLMTGDVNALRSTDSGATWTKVNDWSEYYGNPAAKLHADIMDIKNFTKADGTPFTIVSTHGGCYVSYNNMLTNTNLSATGLNVGQFYSVITDQDKPDNIFAGSQDQGFQRALNATTVNGTLGFTQVISGDYGSLAFSGAPKHLWTQYPGGNIYYYDNPTGNLSATWKMPGSNLPNYGWMQPVLSTGNSAVNEVYMGGGDLNGTSGSYLVKVSASTTLPVQFTSSQFNYNFRANSNNGTSGITAVAVSPLNRKIIYVATEDGTFFYTKDSGAVWAKTSSFNGPGPWYLYGSSILASRLNKNVVWFAGSGYSNAPVYKSTDGGAHFTAMNNGLPSTLVHQVTSNPDETLLFAATDAGPYVYDVSQNQWYSILGTNAPVQSYTGVEYIKKSNIVRFATYGRGIWDFVISGTSMPVTWLNFTAQLSKNDGVLNWSTAAEINSSYFNIERSLNAVNFSVVGKVSASGTSSTQQNYTFTDPAITALNSANVYYRIHEVDKDNKSAYSKTGMITIGQPKTVMRAWPNPVQSRLNLGFDNFSGRLTLSIFDVSGKKVQDVDQIVTPGASIIINTGTLKAGTYFIIATVNGVQIKQKFIKG